MKTEKTKLSYAEILNGISGAYKSTLPHIEKLISKKEAGAYVNESTFSALEKDLITALQDVKCYDCNTEITEVQIDKMIRIAEKGVRKPRIVKKLYSIKNEFESRIYGK